MVKAGSQQVLGKDGEKSTATRSHGMGLVMTLPKEWEGPPAFSTSTGKESDTCGLKTVRVNVKRSISLFVQDGRAECDFTVGRLPNLDNSKYSSLCMPKTVRKGLGSSLSVNAMEKVNQFCLISNCSSENTSRIKVGSMYPCMETVVSMRSNTLPEERRVTESSKNQKCIAQTRCIGPSIKTLKTNPPLTGGKTAELSDWDHTGPRAVDFYNIHNNWGETAVAREQLEKMGTVAAHQEFTNFYASEREERALLERSIIRSRMIVEECRKEVCCFPDKCISNK